MNKLSLIKPAINTNLFDACLISSITDDSRDVQKNSLFVAKQGVESHGKEFIKRLFKMERHASLVIKRYSQT